MYRYRAIKQMHAYRHHACTEQTCVPMTSMFGMQSLNRQGNAPQRTIHKAQAMQVLFCNPCYVCTCTGSLYGQTCRQTPSL